MLLTYTASVRKMSTVVPRGMPWSTAVCAAGLIAFAVYGTSNFPSALSVIEVLIIVAGATLTFSIFWRAKRKALVVDSRGMWLGMGPKEDKNSRFATHLGWSQVQEIQVSPEEDGATVDIVLSEPAPQPRPITGLFAVKPLSYLFELPPLLQPLTDPPRYRVPVHRAEPASVASAFESLSPEYVRVLLSLH